MVAEEGVGELMGEDKRELGVGAGRLDKRGSDEKVPAWKAKGLPVKCLGTWNDERIDGFGRDNVQAGGLRQ
jgi:hypothetical protein